MSNGRPRTQHPPHGANRGGGGGDRHASRQTEIEYRELKEKLESSSLFVWTQEGFGRQAPNKDLFDDVARGYAKHIREGGLKDNTQLRRWFNAVDELNNKAMLGILSSEHIQAEMALLRARIAFASRRPGVRVPSQLVDFVTIGSKKVKNAEDLYVFRRLFECVVAFHRAAQ